MKRNWLFILIFLLIGGTLVSHAASRPLVGGPCTYSTYSGPATVTQLVIAENGCWMHFDSQLQDPHPQTERYQPKSRSCTFVRNPSGETTIDWLQRQGILIGTKLEMKLSLITSGTCTPVIYSFPALHAIID